MKRDIFLSLALHAALVTMTLVSTPFETKVDKEYDEVIQVALYHPPEINPVEQEPAAMVPVSPLQPAVEEIPEIPIDEPTTQSETVIEKKPEPLPETESEQHEPEERTAKPEQVAYANAEETPEEIHSPITGGGSPFAGATIDKSSFNYPYWFTQAFNKILRNWRNPVAADGSVVCAVYFQVIKSGRVIETRIETSSGISAFDDACLRAVERSAPFPPLPRTFADEIVGITLPFKYEPR